MIVSGILLKANEARIVTLAGDKNNHTLIAPKFNKLALTKNPTRDDVVVFSQTFRAYCTDNSIDVIVINRRAASGKGVGGTGTFLIEGVILAISPVPIEFKHSATIRATYRREGELKTAKPNTLDLGKAYDYGFEGLS